MKFLILIFALAWFQTPKLEGCVTCHGLIEPMHKYGTTETLDKLKDGKDAVGLFVSSTQAICAWRRGRVAVVMKSNRRTCRAA